MAFDVFISYAHQDKATADAACAVLESEGTRCWIAPRDIVPGKEWSEAIIDAISQAKIMVLIFSEFANGSPQIKREVERAVNKGVAIIPVRIEDIVPSKALEYFISTPHWLDAFTPPLEHHLRQLSTSVKALLGAGNSQTRGPALLDDLGPETRRASRTFIDRFFRTFLDVWRLRPSRFLTNIDRNPQAYATPYEFFVTVLAIMFAMVLTEATLNQTAFDEATRMQLSDPKAGAARAIIILLVVLGLNTLGGTLVSRIWPVRGHATLASVFQLQCYYLALVLPLQALEVLVFPILLDLTVKGITAQWVLFVPMALGFVFGMIYGFVYQLPAMAFINGVSMRRMLAGSLFWSVLFIAVCGIIGFVGGYLAAVLGF